MTHNLTPYQLDVAVACGADGCKGEATRRHGAKLRADGLPHTHACPVCNWRTDLCDTCGKEMPFDANMRGFTCGGLELQGWLACCGNTQITKCAVEADQAIGAWHLAKGGRSLNAGGVRLRADGKTPGDELHALMERLVRLPELEREVEELRQMRGKAVVHGG